MKYEQKLLKQTISKLQDRTTWKLTFKQNMKKNLQNENTWWRNMNKTRTKYEEKIIKILKKYNISKVLDWAIREVHFWTKYVKSFRNLWNFVSKYFKSFEIYEILSQNMSKASEIYEILLQHETMFSSEFWQIPLKLGTRVRNSFESWIHFWIDVNFYKWSSPA